MTGNLAQGSFITNPAAGETLCSAALEAEPVAGGAFYQVYLLLTAPDEGRMLFCLEAVDGIGVVQKQILFKVPAGETRRFDVSALSFLIPNGYTLRVTSPEAATGSAQASIIWGAEIRVPTLEGVSA